MRPDQRAFELAKYELANTSVLSDLPLHARLLLIRLLYRL